MNKIINLTPHAVTVRGASGDTTIPPSGQVARVSQTLTEVGERGGLRCVRSTYGPVEGLPEEQDVLLLVSAMVRLAVPGRRDVVSPADFIRDEAGWIIACRALEVNL